MKIYLFIAILSLNIFGLFSQKNILESYNGDFENGLENWRLFENPIGIGTSAESTSDAISGSYAMKVNYGVDYGNIVDRGFDNWLTHIPVTEGLTYSLRAFVKGDSIAIESYVKIRFTLGFFDKDGNVINQKDNIHKVNSAYAEKTLTGTAPENSTSCWIAFRLYNAMLPCRPFRSMYIDNVRLIEPWPASATISMEENSEIGLYNYPNPFKDETIIKYTLIKSNTVTLKIYDLLGQEIEILLNSRLQEAGNHEICWNSKNLAEGIYFYRLEVLSASGAKNIFNRKMILEK